MFTKYTIFINVKITEYVKDGYQNVIGIVKDSQVVAKYVYDAWGNIIREEKDSNDSFARINPIRYRSL